MPSGGEEFPDLLIFDHEDTEEGAHIYISHLPSLRIYFYAVGDFTRQTSHLCNRFPMVRLSGKLQRKFHIVLKYGIGDFRLSSF